VQTDDEKIMMHLPFFHPSMNSIGTGKKPIMGRPVTAWHDDGRDLAKSNNNNNNYYIIISTRLRYL
jgi:hypothetical protein